MPHVSSAALKTATTSHMKVWVFANGVFATFRIQRVRWRHQRSYLSRGLFRPIAAIQLAANLCVLVTGEAVASEQRDAEDE